MIKESKIKLTGYLSAEEAAEYKAGLNLSGKCGSCAFWKEREGPIYESTQVGPDKWVSFVRWTGDCHRRSPTAVLVQIDPDCGEELASYGIWPETIPTDWCGDYQKAEDNQ